MDSAWHWTNDVWASGPLPFARSFLSTYIGPEGAQVLAAQDADRAWPLASLTKLMTALVAVDLYGFDRLQDDLRAMLIVSDNQVADTIAARAGTEDFVARRNEKAAALGLSSMRFVNPSGLDTSAALNVGSASDIAALLGYLYREEPQLFSILGEKYYGTSTSTNTLLFGPVPLMILGGKTGETPQAGQNLAVISKSPRESGYIVSVVFGSADRFADMRALLTYARDAYSW